MKWSFGLSVLLLSADALASSSLVPNSSFASVRPKGRKRVISKSQILSLQGGADSGLPTEDPGVPPSEELLTGSADIEQPPAAPIASAPSSITPESISMTAPPIASVTVVPPAGFMGPNASPPGFLRRKLPGFPWHRLPNLLTYARCLAIPAMVILFYQSNRHIATSVLFAGASLTDWFDGFLARRWDIASRFGAFLDPVADKLMVSTALVLLAGRYGAPVAVPASIILAREIAVSALREWMGQRGLRDSVKVGYQGKAKTALTMLSLTLLLLVPDGVRDGALGKLYEPCMVMLSLSALITVTSGSLYFRAAAPVLLAQDGAS